jgi:uncharacterized protein (TIGR03437 family)
LGDGQGSFALPVNFVTGAGPAQILTGDFNADQKPDIAVTHNAAYAALLLNVCVPSGNLSCVSAASYRGARLATESIVAAFGRDLSDGTQAATSTPLPTTLANTQVAVKDSLGTERLAPLFFVSPDQINYQLPSGMATGTATITVLRGNSVASAGAAQISLIAPGIFAANADGQGVAAAIVLRVKADGTQIFEPVAKLDTGQNKFLPDPIDLGPESDRVFLVLFGTGFRYRSTLSAVTGTMGGTYVQVFYAGMQGELTGLDQSNLLIPRSLAGRGEIDVTMMVDGQMTNMVKINVQ